jgi:hypothetical protein
MSEIAVQVVGIFALMFGGITVSALWFTHSSEKNKSKETLQKQKMEIYDKHFSEMVRIECPYCRTLYTSNTPECPNCGAETRKILFPKMPS